MNALKRFSLRAFFFILWPLGILSFLFLAFAIWRGIVVSGEQQHTHEAVAAIQSRHITLDDVMGKNLPPAPDPAKNDATLAGIDANGNGIRDDVELAIFKEYPNSARIRAAELQYALELQDAFSNVFNSDTWVAYAVSTDRGYQCIGDTIPIYGRSLVVVGQILDSRIGEVENLVFNTELRKAKEKEVDNLITGYGLPNNNFCDIASSTLSK